MILQISSGQGPAECELGVGKLYSSLRAEYPDIEMIYAHPAAEKNAYKSILFSTENDLSFLDGSVLWICESPVRPHHKRKNWYIDVSVIDAGKDPFGNTPEKNTAVDNRDIRFERFHSGGNGGQNVNKVETGVRLIHIPTGITVTSTSQRSQEQNRADAMRKLRAVLENIGKDAKAKEKKDAWKEHNRLQRGNPVRTYRGMDFQMRS